MTTLRPTGEWPRAEPGGRDGRVLLQRALQGDSRVGAGEVTPAGPDASFCVVSIFWKSAGLRLCSRLCQRRGLSKPSM